MSFATIGSKEASWLEREFVEEEVREVVFEMSGDSAGTRQLPYFLFPELLARLEVGNYGIL